jgi:hypothetical protein
MATLFPGNPISIGAPTVFSDVGGTNTSGGALNALNSFKAALGGGAANTAPAPQTGGFRTITWDAVKLDGTDSVAGPNSTIVINSGKTVAIPLNRFQGQGVFFGDEYAVSGDGFTDVNSKVTSGTFPAFSPSNTFAMFNDNKIDQSFILPSAPGSNPALAGTRGFGAIFINNQTANTSSIEYFHGALSLGKFFVKADATPGDPEFLGVLFNNPIVTSVTLTLGTDVLFNFNGSAATGVGTNPANLVVTDDFVYAEPVSSINNVAIDDVPVLPGPNGTLNAQPKASATVATAFTGPVATFSYNPAALASQFTATINWGDGHTTNGTVQANASGGFDVIGTNTYGFAGAIPISVHVQDLGLPRAPDLDVSNVVQVAAAATTTALTVSPSPVIASQTLTLTAKVTPTAGGANNGGFVEFEDNGLPVGVAPVDKTGTATFTTTRLTPGTHNLSAVFLGTPSFTTSTSTSVAEAVRSDVTGQIAITLGSIRRRGRRFIQHVTLRNTGGALPGPIFLVLDNLGPGAKLLNALGMTANSPPNGSPFITVVNAPGPFAAGATIDVVVILTGRPRTVRFTPRVLAGISQP